MNTCSFFSRFFNTSILPRVVVIVIALACNSLSFCNEIHDAARNGDLAKVKALLSDNPDLVFSKESNSGLTPLTCAASRGRKDVVKLLLANKADVNAKADDGATPLCLAADHGHVDVVELLLANKADVNAKDDRGNTPLLSAVKGHKDIVQLLLSNKADVNAKANNGETPLIFAADRGHRDIAELLLANGAEVNAKNGDGTTPLHIAAFKGHKDVVELLLANKAEVNAKDNDGATPLHLAAQQGRKEVAELLLANKADVNAKANNGMTPLHAAVIGTDNSQFGLIYEDEHPEQFWGEKDMTQLLLANGAEVNAKNNAGETPLVFAAAKGSQGRCGITIEPVPGTGTHPGGRHSVGYEFRSDGDLRFLFLPLQTRRPQMAMDSITSAAPRED